MNIKGKHKKGKTQKNKITNPTSIEVGQIKLLCGLRPETQHESLSLKAGKLQYPKCGAAGETSFKLFKTTQKFKHERLSLKARKLYYLKSTKSMK